MRGQENSGKRPTRKFVCCFAIASILVGLMGNTVAEPDERPPQPNVLFILADDLGWGDLGYQGNQDVETPHLDALAKTSARLEHFYISPDSAPTRATMLTGRHFLLNSVTSDTGGAQHLHPGEITIAEALRDRGYRTGYFGKWQLGANYPLNPQGQGFDQFEGYCRLDHEVSPREQESILQAATEFIQSSDSKPFFLQFSSANPALAFSGSDKTGLADLYQALSAIDREVGSLLAALEPLAEGRETLVIFTSDSGPSPLRDRFQARLYGSKGSLHEGGLRAPCLIRLPGVIPSNARVTEITQHIDLFPTIAGFCDAEIPQDRSMDGLDLSPLLRFGHVDRWPNRNLNFAAVPGKDLSRVRSGLRNSRWRAVKDPLWRRGDWEELVEQWELYDIAVDPYQLYDLSETYPYVLAKLKSDYVQWFRHATTFGYDAVRTELGHDNWPEVTLPAESAVLAHHTPLPEALILDGWSRVSYEPEWPILVVDACECEGVLIYRAKSPGTIEITVNDVTNSVELLPSPDWKRAKLGSFHFQEGEGMVTLQTKAARAGLEVREIIWTRR